MAMASPADMSIKRKRSDSIDPQAQYGKRPKTGALLSQLPAEILDMILDYVVPDARFVQSSGNPKATMTMYTAPILQVSRLFRSQGIGIINKRVLWTRLNCRRDDVFAELSESFESLPIIPPQFHYLIPDNPAQVVFNIDQVRGRESDAEQTDKPNTLLFPLNFGEIIRFCDELSGHAWNSTINSLLLEFENMTEQAWRDVSNFISPALSVVHNFEVIDFRPDWIEWDDKVALPIVFQSDPQEPSFIELVNLVREITDHALKLESQQLIDELDLFNLYSIWTLEAAEKVLPAPSDWSMGEADPLDRIRRRFVELEGRCPLGNELRQSLFRLQRQACIAYNRLFSKYGPAWCAQHPWSDHHGLNLLEDPSYGSFGLSDDDRVRLYSSRALVCVTLDEKRLYEIEKGLQSMPETRNPFTFQLYSHTAAEHMYFARALQPENVELRTLYEKYRSQISDSEVLVEELESQWEDRFITEQVPGTDIVWRGDIENIETWGGPEVLQYLPLAQKMPVEKTAEELDQYLREAYAILKAQGRPVPEGV